MCRKRWNTTIAIKNLSPKGYFQMCLENATRGVVSSAQNKMEVCLPSFSSIPSGRCTFYDRIVKV